MNVLIKGLHNADLWVSYSNNDGELDIDSIYLGTDPERQDLYDFLSDSVIEKADSTMREDFAEIQAESSHERYKCARYYDEQGGWL